MLPTELLNVLPTSVSMEVSTKCPLNCIYCKRKGKGDNMDNDKYDQILKKIESGKHFKNVVYCGIGESFMNPHFYDMVKRSFFDGVSVISSGMLPIDFKFLKETGKLKLAIFSIDAVTEDTIKSTCGANYRYDVLVENLKKLREISVDDKNIMTLMNCTVNKNNYNCLSDIIGFAKEHKFKIVHFSLPWDAEDFIIDNLKEIEISIMQAKKLAKEAHILCDNPFRSYCCIQYDSILPFVNIDGDLFPCGYALHQNYKVGNLFEEDFDVLWNKDKYEEFRKGKLCKSCFMMRMEKIRSGEIKHEL